MNTDSKPTHTPTPWKVDQARDGGGIAIFGQPAKPEHDYRWVALCDDTYDTGRREESEQEIDRENAAFIARAVNNHKALVRLVKWAYDEGSQTQMSWKAWDKEAKDLLDTIAADEKGE